MKAFLFTFLFASALAHASQESVLLKEIDPLECKVDADNPKDPYQKMLTENKRELERDYPVMKKLNIFTTQRERFWEELSSSVKKVCAARDSMQALSNTYLAKAKAGNQEQGCAVFREIEPEFQALGAKGTQNSQLANAEAKNLASQVKQWSTTEFSVIEKRKAIQEMRGPYERVWPLKISQDQRTPPTEAERTAWFRKGAKRPLVMGYLLQLRKEAADSQRFINELVAPARASLLQTAGNCPSLTGQPVFTSNAQTNNGNVIAINGSDGVVFDGRNGPLQAKDPGWGVANGIIPPGSIPPPGTPEKQSWVSENKSNLIVGGVGVAAIGGALLYKRNLDKKAKREDNLYNSMALTASNETQTDTSTATATGTSTNTSTETQRLGKQLRMNGSPNSAKVNQTLTPIVVYLVDDQGNKVNDENVEIRVECTKACSLNGILTLLTKEGAVEFRNLKFSAAQTGVQFRFSASGLNSITSEGSFPVIE